MSDILRINGVKQEVATSMETLNLKLYQYDANTLSLENIAGGTYKNLRLGNIDLNDYANAIYVTEQYGLKQRTLRIFGDNGVYTSSIALGNAASGAAEGAYAVFVGAGSGSGLPAGAGLGEGCVALGCATLQGSASTTTAMQYNVAVGDGPGQYITTARDCVLIGSHAAYGNPFTASYTTIVGSEAGRALTSGAENVLIGFNAGWALTTQEKNVIVGTRAGQSLTDGYNTFVGWSAGTAATTATSNTLVGYNLVTLTTGDNNVILGAGMGGVTTGSRSILIGVRSATDITTDSNYFALDTNEEGIGLCYMSGLMSGARWLRLVSDRATAGATVKSFTLKIRDQYWSAGAVTTHWDSSITHSMITGGATPKSSLIFAIGAEGAEVTLLTLENNNGVRGIGFFGANTVVQQTGTAAQKTDYATPDLDTEAEIIVAFNTTNAAINALRTAMNNLGLTTVV